MRTYEVSKDEAPQTDKPLDLSFTLTLYAISKYNIIFLSVIRYTFLYLYIMYILYIYRVCIIKKM